MKRLITIVLMCLCAVAIGQTINFAARVTMEYTNMPLDAVLEDLTRRYGVKFSYSRQIIPVDTRVDVHVTDVSLNEGLKALFINTQVIYGFIGDQLVLSVDPSKDIGAVDRYPDDSIADAGDALLLTERETVPSPTKLRSSWSAFEMDVAPRNWTSRNTEYVLHERQRRLEQAASEQGALRLQASLFPPLQVRSHPYSDLPVNLSFNLFWGVNNSLNGFELGGFGNHIRGDVTGVQLAGAFNGAGGQVRGAQASGFGNYVVGRSTGVQMGGIGNIAREGGDLVQMSGGVNISGSHLAAQMAAGVNVAERVAVQIAPVNVADHVTGLQLGVINVADTVSGTAIGLFTFVRNGYRSFELAGQESLHANAMFRLGVRTFYNIFHVGVNDDHARTWSLGYGLGTSIRSGRSSYLQLEIMSRHVNEEESWTNTLNLLNSFNVVWDIKVAGSVRLALGPTFNVGVSKRYNPQTDAYGLDVPRYTIHERTYFNNGDPVNVKYWIGFHAGLRLSTD